MIVLDTAAAVREAAKDSVGSRKKRSRCRIDDDAVARHIARAEREAAEQRFVIGGGWSTVEGQCVVRDIAAVGHIADKAGCRADHIAAIVGIRGVVAWCMCIVNRHILPADIGSVRR